MPIVWHSDDWEEMHVVCDLCQQDITTSFVSDEAPYGPTYHVECGLRRHLIDLLRDKWWRDTYGGFSFHLPNPFFEPLPHRKEGP